MLVVALAVAPMSLGLLIISSGPSSLGCSIGTQTPCTGSNTKPGGHGSIVGCSSSTGCVVGGATGVGVSVIPSPTLGKSSCLNCGNSPCSISLSIRG